MGQRKAPRQESRPASRLFDGSPQSGKGIAQLVVPDSAKSGLDTRCRLRVRGRLNMGRLATQRRLSQPERSHCLPAQETIDALQNDVGKVLDLQRRWSFHAQHELARFRELAIAGPRPLNFLRLRVIRNVGTYDFSPAGDKL